MSKLMEAAGSRRESTPTDHLDDRIAAAFADGAKSDDVASLIREAEAAAIAAGDTAERARSRALDPALSAPDVAAARREMDDAAFRRDRLQVAGKRLGERLREVRADEEDQRRWIAYKKAKAERDELSLHCAHGMCGRERADFVVSWWRDIRAFLRAELLAH
jgi:hypothetical protein